MRKIKNFKVNLRVKEIFRAIKKLTNTVELPIELETVRQSCHFYSDFLYPSVIYETFSKEELPFVYDKDVPKKWIAESIFFITVGDAVYDEYKKSEKAFGQYTGKIVSAIVVDALEQSKNFIQRLISNEAQEENCWLSKSINISQNLYEIAAKDIPIDKIGINIESKNLNPQSSICGLFYWIPSNKKAKK